MDLDPPSRPRLKHVIEESPAVNHKRQGLAEHGSEIPIPSSNTARARDLTQALQAAYEAAGCDIKVSSLSLGKFQRLLQSEKNEKAQQIAWEAEIQKQNSVKATSKSVHESIARRTSEVPIQQQNETEMLTDLRQLNLRSNLAALPPTEVAFSLAAEADTLDNSGGQAPDKAMRKSAAPAVPSASTLSGYGKQDLDVTNVEDSPTPQIQRSDDAGGAETQRTCTSRESRERRRLLEKWANEEGLVGDFGSAMVAALPSWLRSFGASSQHGIYNIDSASNAATISDGHTMGSNCEMDAQELAMAEQDILQLSVRVDKLVVLATALWTSCFPTSRAFLEYKNGRSYCSEYVYGDASLKQLLATLDADQDPQEDSLED